MTVTLDQVLEYLTPAVYNAWAVVDGATTTYPAIEDALAAETRAQARRVRYPDGPIEDLDEALKRRVQRNLAMRHLPLAVQQGNADTGALGFRAGSTDPEIRRLETPYRKRPVG